MGRPALYPTNAARQGAYRQRRRQELQQLRTAPTRAPRHPRHELDVYETPLSFVRAGLALVTTPPEWVLDLAAGDGRWGQEVKRRWPRAKVVGVELRDLPPPTGFDFWLPRTDARLLDLQAVRFDLVVSNPPYIHAEAMVRRGLSLLRPGGTALFLLRLAFREGQRRARGLFAEYPPAEIAVADRRPIFYGTHGGTLAHAFSRWTFDHHGPTVCTTAVIEEERDR